MTITNISPFREDGVAGIVLVFSDESGTERLRISSDNAAYEQVARIIDRELDENSYVTEEASCEIYQLVTREEWRGDGPSVTISHRGGTFFIGDEPADPALAQHLSYVLSPQGTVIPGAEDDWTALAAYAVRLAANPSPDVRQGLYSWISRAAVTGNQVSITPAGRIIAYIPGGGEPHEPVIFLPEGALADGEQYHGMAMVTPGTIVSFPGDHIRQLRWNEPRSGLFADGADRIPNPGGNLVAVAIDPADVAFLPANPSGPLAVSRFEVIGGTGTI